MNKLFPAPAGSPCGALGQFLANLGHNACLPPREQCLVCSKADATLKELHLQLPGIYGSIRPGSAVARISASELSCNDGPCSSQDS